MTEDKVHAMAEQLVRFYKRFALLFGKKQAQDHAYTYAKGRLVCPERKSIKPIALNVGVGQVSALQKFINIAPWEHGEVQAVFADKLVPTAIDSPIRVVGVVDERVFTEKGTHCASVARQYNDRLGKEDNCQVGVILVGVTPGSSVLLNHQLYLPESWCEDTRESRTRRQKVHIPDNVGFQTKPQITDGLICQIVALGIMHLD
ncbi:transposase [Singulisphaera sp. GP187]|uniref:transposase n=1 Tax=Singulisphaera sp. GP187 TaxID=1882752 RepID=UPI000940BEAE|nr:transposase [Singulisphaera sp. GP187]